MDTQKLEYLSMVDIFQDLSPDEVANIDQMTTMSTCKAGRIFYMPDETGEVLFLLKKGRVQLYRISPDGKKLVVATLGPGAVACQEKAPLSESCSAVRASRGLASLGVQSLNDSPAASNACSTMAVELASVSVP